ncbi:MAG: CPBP family intramembrane metalloprotease [Sphingomonadales bacterium]|nr:CPBP family intramembrane metalloprotease [Sphingomonadales bacterium]MBD3774812.1 CPBP family intramembrane metalloprotease [Paracoccaceae bacterium]
MSETTAKVPGAKPMWRRIVDFPLVALVISLGLLVATGAAFGWLMRRMPEYAGKDVTNLVEVLALIAALTLVYKLVIARIGDPPRDDLPFHLAPRHLAIGTLVAFVLFTAVVGIAALLGAYRIVGPGGWTDFLSILAMAGISAGFVEELIFRGILFRWLEDFGGSWFALAITSALFGLAHILNDNATWFSSLAIALEAGVMLGGAYMLTRSLWLAMGIHFGWNVTQGFIWDVPVSGQSVEGLVEAQLRGNEYLSGGAFGLEASVIALVLATGLGLYFVWLAIQRGELVRPWWVRRRLARQSAGE